MSWFRPLQNPDHPDVIEAMGRECPICHATPEEPCDQPYTGVVHHERAYPLSLGTAGRQEVGGNRMSQDPAAQLILSKWITDRAKEWETEAKQQLGLLPGERKAAVVNGQVLGHVSMVKGRTTGSVANAEALLAYVKAHHPTEVEQVVEERIRPAFLKSLLDDAAKKGAFVDSDGVVIDGLIDVRQGDPYPTRKLTEDADILIAGLMARGALGVSGLKEIGASE